MYSGIDEIFKAYDVRGLYPSQLNVQVVARIGEAYAAIQKPKQVAVGCDVRTSGNELKEALIQSLLSAGVDVVDIGTITTDQLYFTVGHYGYDGGISVTASHNPGEYNGLKFSESGGAPIASETLLSIRDRARSNDQPMVGSRGRLSKKEILEDYINHVLTYVDYGSIKPLHIVANANFGAVGRGLDKIAGKLNLKLDRLNWQQDGSFPKGPPNPLLPENRNETVELIKAVQPDFGVAWDADADRVFFFSGDGEFIPSCYIIAILSQSFLKSNPGEKIVHDLTTAWVIDDSINKAGGVSISNRTGHTFIKARMRREDAIFGGESSGHYYFRDSFYADNGIVPFLMVLELISKSGKTLQGIVKPLMDRYKVSGEINFTVPEPAKAISVVEQRFGGQGKIDKTDGLVVDSGTWRFSVRASNTEPLFRLNAEARDQQTLNKLIKEITALINT